MRRPLLLLPVPLALLAAAAPALAGGGLTMAASGDATAVTATSADLNGAAYRVGDDAHWLFQYTRGSSFHGVGAAAVSSTAANRLGHHVTAIESHIAGLAPSTRYAWRVVVETRSAGRLHRTFGITRVLTTADGATPAPSTTTTASSTTTTSASTSTTSSTPAPAGAPTAG